MALPRRFSSAARCCGFGPTSTSACHHHPRAAPRVRDRPYLAGSSSASFPATIPYASDTFPLRLDPTAQLGFDSDLDAVGGAVREAIEAHLPHAGAVLFQGLDRFDCVEPSSASFSRLFASLRYRSRGYGGGVASRVSLAKDVLTASDDPAVVSIEPHIEMCYIPEPLPSKIMFFCRTPPANGDEGGQTPIMPIRPLLERLDPAIVARFRELGVRYYRHCPDESRTGPHLYSWQRAYFTDNRASVEEQCRALGYDYAWNEATGMLTTSFVTPALRIDAASGEELWQNQATASHHSYYADFPEIPADATNNAVDFPGTTSFGNGDPIEPEVIEHIRAKMWECAVAVPWETADLLVIDNNIVAHGRMSFAEDSARSLCVAIAE